MGVRVPVLVPSTAVLRQGKGKTTARTLYTGVALLGVQNTQRQHLPNTLHKPKLITVATHGVSLLEGHLKLFDDNTDIMDNGINTFI